jgi:hypothetical protein
MMKRVMILIFSLAVLIGMGLATSAALAGDGPYGEIRWRWEGWKNLDGNSDFDDSWGANYLRSRMGYKTHVGERGLFNISFENVRVMGRPDEINSFYTAAELIPGLIGFLPTKENIDLQDVSIPTFNDQVYIHEAYFGLKDFLFEGFDAYAGRFGLRYGNERVLGVEDWENFVQFRYDGFKGRYHFDDGWLDLLCLKMAETEDYKYWGPWIGINPDGDGDVDMRGAYLHYDSSDELFFEPYIFMISTNRWQYTSGTKQATDENDLSNDNIFLFGGLVDYMGENGFHAYGEGILQTGTIHYPNFDNGFTESEIDISALGFYGGVVYHADSEQEPFIGAEFNYASGTSIEDATPDDDGNFKIGTFISPYGSFSQYMGRMNQLAWSNTASFRFMGGITPTENLNVRADFWMFKLAEEEDHAYFQTYGLWSTPDFVGPIRWSGVDTDPDTPGDQHDKSVGTEIDIFLTYEVEDGIMFEGGLGIFSYGDYWPQTVDANGEDMDLDTSWFAWIGGSVAMP